MPSFFIHFYLFMKYNVLFMENVVWKVFEPYITQVKKF